MKTRMKTRMKTMLGHLKAEDFVNMMENTPLPDGAPAQTPDLRPDLRLDKRRRHLESCARCAATLKSVEAVRNQVTEMQMSADEFIPEPDWSEVRGDVRNALLSRSVKRDTTNRSWLAGMGWKPVAAWGFSILLVFGLTTGVVLWNQNSSIGTTGAEVALVDQQAEPAVTAVTIDAIASMRETDVFDDVLHLNEKETEGLNRLLENLTRNGAK